MILQMLLNADRPVPSYVMGGRIGISARSVRYELAALEAWTAQYGVTICSEPHKGVHLQGDELALKRLGEALKQVEAATIMTTRERDQLILFSLLTADSFQPSPELEALAGISSATLTRSIPRLEDWLESRQLYLQRKVRSGLGVVGRELDRRHALIHLLMDIFSEMALLDYCIWGKNPLTNPAMQPNSSGGVIFAKVESWRLNDAWRHISRLEQEMKLSISDSDHLYLALYFGLMIYRLGQGHLVDLPAEMIQYISSHQEFSLINEMALRVNQELNRTIPDVELAQFTIEAVSALRLEEIQGMEGITQAQAVELASEIANKVRSILNLPVAQPEAVTRMGEHLWRSLTRIKYGLMIANPLTDQVQKTLPDLWDATRAAVSSAITEWIDLPIPPEEIAYLTMYLSMAFGFPTLQPQPAIRVVVVCPTGGITAWMLVSRLRAELPDLEIREVLSIRQLSGMNLDGVRAIISTASFTYRDLPVISVSPLVTDQEVGKIRELLRLTSARMPRIGQLSSTN
jgi:transcriptional antiterminator